jgi:hypothetical protein
MRLAAAAAALSLACWAGAADEKDAKKVETKKIQIGTYSAQAPASWEVQTVKSQFRAGQFKIAKVEGDPADAEFIIFHFAGGGGGLEENINRWHGFFKQPDGKPTKEVAKRTEFKIEPGRVVAVDISGTYLDRPFPMSPNFTAREKYRMLAAYVDVDNGPYFLRLIGPAKTVEANAAGWEAMLKSIKP